jgi:hypothetical protein
VNENLETPASTEQSNTAPIPSDERIAGAKTPSLGKGESFFSRAIIIGSLFVVPLLLLIFYYKAMFVGLINNSAMDYAQLGRNLSEGRGFSTFYLRPLAMTHGDSVLQQPDVINMPLFPFILALAFGARGLPTQRRHRYPVFSIC